MASSFRASSAVSVLGPVAFLLAVPGCSSSAGGPVSGTGGSGSGATTSSGGSAASGGTIASGGAPGTGGKTAGTGGSPSSGGAPGTGGATKTGGTTGVPTSGGAVGSGASVGTGGAGKGGVTGAGGTMRRDGGPPVADARPGTGGTTVNIDIDGGPNCNATMPTSGGKSYTGTNGGSSIDGYNFGIWTNGKGGTITAFPGGAFTTNWSESQDFLAHLGFDYRGGKPYADLGTVVAEFAEKKSGSAGSFSMIGMYGWMNSPCVEWYINEDAWNGLYGGGGTSVTIDGGSYSLSMTTTTGTGGANACESGHSGGWTQIKSTRKSARSCGIVTISEHFAAWEKQGWQLGAVTSIHINVEVGGGTGSIDFPVANIMVSGK